MIIRQIKQQINTSRTITVKQQQKLRNIDQRKNDCEKTTIDPRLKNLSNQINNNLR